MLLPQAPAISRPAPPALTLASPASVQKYNQIRKALGMAPSQEKTVFQQTLQGPLVRRVLLFTAPPKKGEIQIILNLDTGALTGIGSDLGPVGLHKRYEESPGPLLSRKDVESLLESLASFSLTKEDRKNWELFDYATTEYDSQDLLSFPDATITLRRLVDNAPVIASRISLTVETQSGQVYSYKYEEGVLVPQTQPLIPEPVARAIAQKAFLEAGGSPEARCRLVWDKVAWWPIARPLSRPAYRYEFELRKKGMPAEKEGVVWGVPIDAQTGEIWGIRLETGGGGVDAPPVTTRGNAYFQRFPFANDSPDAQKFSITALSINKPEPATAPETFSCLVTPRHRVYYHWDKKHSRLTFSVNDTKSWYGGVLHEKAAWPFIQWLNTQPSTQREAP